MRHCSNKHMFVCLLLNQSSLKVFGKDEKLSLWIFFSPTSVYKRNKKAYQIQLTLNEYSEFEQTRFLYCINILRYSMSYNI